MLDKINALMEEIASATASTPAELEELRVRYLAKKGLISQLMTDFRNVPSEQKRELGRKLNELKDAATQKIAELKEGFAASRDDSDSELDLTRTATPLPQGSRHPLSIVKADIIRIFSDMGFTIAEGPEIEDDWHVFSSLNFPPDHPARDMQDTFFIGRTPVDVLLRTHTSSVQTRTMEANQPPIRIVCPGRVYRNEAISARAHCFFHQIEGLYIDRNVSFADLKQVLLYFRPGDADPTAPLLLPLHRAIGRDGHQLRPLRRQGMRLLQRHRMGGDPRLRHGRPQCAQGMRHRPGGLFRLRLRHGHRAYHQPEIQSERPAHV